MSGQVVKLTVNYIHEYRVISVDETGEETVLHTAPVGGLTPLAKTDAGVLSNRNAQSAYDLLKALGHPVDSTNFLASEPVEPVTGIEAAHDD